MGRQHDPEGDVDWVPGPPGGLGGDGLVGGHVQPHLGRGAGGWVWRLQSGTTCPRLLASSRPRSLLWGLSLYQYREQEYEGSQTSNNQENKVINRFSKQ